jgi:hypothetical protein
MILVEQSKSEFARAGIAVVESEMLESQEVISNQSAEVGAGGVKVPILLITPVSYFAQSNGRVMTSHGVFSALLIDPESKQTIWEAIIDTYTGSKIFYDEEYASQLFKAILKRMKKDSII